MKAYWRFLLILFIFLFLIQGCSHVIFDKDAGDEANLSRAMKLIEEEDYSKAVEVLRMFIDEFPTSPLIGKAYFEVGRAYFLDEQSVDAEIAFDDFIRLYPDSSLVPKALYLKGESLERDMAKPGRDQTTTRDAMNIYSELINRFPESEEAGRAKVKIRWLRNRLAENEIIISEFYMRIDKYSSANKRLMSAFEKYSDTKSAERIVSLLAESYLYLGKEGKALELLQYLKTNYPQGKEMKQLEKKIGEKKG